MTDWVRPLKIENLPDGGSYTDSFPHELDPANDGVHAKRFGIETQSTIIAKDASNNMTFTDLVSGTYTLAQLAASAGALVTATVTTTYTITTEDVIFGNPSADFNVTLPSPTNGKKLYIKNIRTSGTNYKVTILPSASESIDNDSSLSLHKGEAVLILSDGTDWWVN